MTESVMVYNEPTRSCCGKPTGQCSCVPAQNASIYNSDFENPPKPEAMPATDWDAVYNCGSAFDQKQPGIPGVNDPQRDGLNTPMIADRPTPLGLPIMEF